MLPEEIAEARQRRYNGTLAWVRKPYPDLMVFRVRPDFAIPKHRAGQYCSLGLGNWEPRTPGCQEEQLKPGDESKVVRRAYSISNSLLDDAGNLLDPAKTDYLEFYITLVREGSDPAKPPALTPRLFMLREGDRLNIGEKITGHYTLEPVKPGDTVLFLGTGTGEAPHNYMILELLRGGHTGKILHACCVRYLRDLAYIETHHRLMARHANYQYQALTTRESDTVGKKVYIQDLITSGQIEVAARRTTRSGPNARVPMRQPEHDWRAAEEPGDRRSRVSEAGRSDRDPGRAGLPGRQRGRQIEGQYSLRGILVSRRVPAEIFAASERFAFCSESVKSPIGGQPCPLFRFSRIGFMPEVNETIGGYRLRSLLQTGQVSQVFEVVEPLSNRHFAMKILLPEAAEKREVRTNLFHEAEVGIKLRHENVIHILKISRNVQSPHFIMEYFPSGSMRTRLMAKDFTFIKENAMKVFKQAATGLAYMHASNWVHCDVKPDNMLVNAGGPS